MSHSLVAKGIVAARRLLRRSPASAFRGLLSREQFDRVLQRERVRCDRSGGRFSLATLSVDRGAAHRDTLTHLAKILRQRLRLTDDAGLLDARRLGVVLPDTPASGAWALLNDVILHVPAGLPLPECSVFIYPGNCPPGNGSDDEQTGAGHPAGAVEELFGQRLPLWKRTADVVGASLGLLLLAPLLAAVAVAIKATSAGPVFFRQRRSGLAGRPFVMLKFRSMVVDAERRKQSLMAMNEQDGPAFKIKNDPRTTALGRFLRRTSIDELPQLWNVLRGDMSLVGPRPLPCNETDACRGWLRQRLDVTPGLTCIWQVRGRSTVLFAEWVRMDVAYIRSRSVMADAKLLFQTVPAVLARRGAS